MTYRGQDLENILFNPSIHRHGFSALRTLEQYKFGVIITAHETPPKKLVQTQSTAPASNPSSRLAPQPRPLTPTRNPKKQGSQSEILQKEMVNQLHSFSPIQAEKQPAQINQDKQAQKSITLAANDKKQNKMNEFTKQISSVSSKVPPQRTFTSQFLEIPNPREVLAQQKLKMHRMLQEERNKQLELEQKHSSEHTQRQTQSEIISVPKPKTVNSFYEQWKQRQDQQQVPQQEKVIRSKLTQSLNDLNQKKEQTKPVNSYYQEWLRRQQMNNQSIITEQEDEYQGSRKRASSLFSTRSMMQEEEEPCLRVPILEPKFLANLKVSRVNI